jgi:uncharacterized protein YbjQ (UPF0145 family)
MVELIILAVTLAIAFTAGKIEQNVHYRFINNREAQYSYRSILLFNEKIPPPEYAGQPFGLVCGSVVMGSDYFRQFLAGLKALFGGRLTSFEAMLDRGRREAILRMKAEAKSMGADVIFNVHLATSTLSIKRNGSGGACVEIVAYGTAWRKSNVGKIIA